MKSESDEATTSDETDSDFGGEESSELAKDEEEINQNEKDEICVEETHDVKEESNDSDKSFSPQKFQNSVLENASPKNESVDFDEATLKQTIIKNKNRLADLIFDEPKLDIKGINSSRNGSRNSPALSSSSSSHEIKFLKENRKSPLKTPEQSVLSTPEKLTQDIDNTEKKNKEELEIFQVIAPELNDDRTENFSTSNHTVGENEARAFGDNESEFSSLVPQNEPVPEPAPSKPRLESRAVISAASSCTLPSQCSTPEPDRIKSPAGGYEDILNVLERLEDELYGQDKRQKDRSASTTSRSTRSSSMSSTSTSSRASGKSGIVNLSKIK